MSTDDEIANFFTQSMEEAIASVEAEASATSSSSATEEHTDNFAEDSYDPDPTPSVVDGAQKEWESDEIFKKYWKASGRGGFLTITGWAEADKIALEVGSLNAENKLEQAVKVFVDASKLATYLYAVATNTAERLFPQNSKAGAPAAESFASFGGAKSGGQPVSRILKIHPLIKRNSEGQPTGEVDASKFEVKCGHFEARVSNTGAFIPDMSKPVKTDSIQLSRTEIAELYHRVNLWQITNHVAKAIS